MKYILLALAFTCSAKATELLFAYDPATFAGIEAIAKVRPCAVVVNVADGPGTRIYPEWERFIAALDAHSGVTLYGYSDLIASSGKGPVKTVTAIKAEAAAWRRFYGITRLFLDDCAVSNAAIKRTVTGCGFSSSRVILNPGSTVPNSGEWMYHAGLVCDHEGPLPLAGSSRLQAVIIFTTPSRYATDRAAVLARNPRLAGFVINGEYEKPQPWWPSLQ